MLKYIKKWFYGKQVRVNPDEPETLGPLGVLHEYTTELHWSAKLAHSFIAFYWLHWKWLWTTTIATVTAYIGLLQAFSCK